MMRSTVIVWSKRLLLLLGSSVASAALAADIGVGVFLDKNFASPGESNPTISISAFNNGGARIVDVHVGIIASNGTIYEYPDGNTALRPWLSGFTVPANFNYPATKLVTLPDLPPGIWQAFVALTEPGSTTDIISVSLAPFNILSASGDGTKYGALVLAHSQKTSGADVDANAIFVESSTDFGNLVQNIEGKAPGVDQCVFNQLANSLASIQNISVVTLDAGSAVELDSSTGSSITLSKDTQFGFMTYDANPTSGFYQGGVNYTFRGNGGMDISAFSAAVTAPEPLNLTQPSPDSSISHSHDSDLTLAWNGNNGVGVVEVHLVGVGLSGSASIDCRFADDGSASIPAMLLTQLFNTLASTTGSVGGIELPAGIEIPGLSGGTVSLTVSRINYSIFNTVGGDLDFGIVTATSGAGTSVLLQ